jgi:AcrR family transcriptional regulator
VPKSLGNLEPSDASGRKGEQTRAKIVARAYQLCGRTGLEALTIGELASELGLSKSGLFAHFGSKENLLLAVLEAGAKDYEVNVFHPALKSPRGVPRLRALLNNWLGWIDAKSDRGCVLLAGAMEWDDREGLVRDALVSWFQKLQQLVERAFQLAVEEGHVSSNADLAQLAGEFHGIVLKYHLDARLLRREGARARATLSLDRILASAQS